LEKKEKNERFHIIYKNMNKNSSAEEEEEEEVKKEEIK
jgi:hypothetical protein